MYCIECGKQVQEVAKFCSFCGTRVVRHEEITPQPEKIIIEKVTSAQLDEVSNVTELTTESDNYASDHSQPIDQHDNQVRPWVRYLARMIDISILTCLTVVFLSLDIVPLGNLDEPKAKLALMAWTIPIWLYIETWVLSIFGTTPGKSLLKINLSNIDGSKAEFDSIFKRTISVWFKGLGLALPIVGIITMLVSYSNLKKNGAASWDTNNGLKITHGRIGAWRVFLAIILIFVLGIGLNVSLVIIEYYAA